MTMRIGRHPHNLRTAPGSATAQACSPVAGQSFSPPVADALTFTARSQEREVAALQRLASPTGWLMQREEARRDH